MENAVKRIGVLTSGGDAPGMNACIRAVVRSANARGIECVGIRRGWQGLISGDILEMDNASVSRIINRGGTILYSARCDEFRTHEGQEKAYATCKLIGLDGLVAIGGDGTFRGAQMNEIAAEEMGTVREVCLSDATPVEYGTVLFYVEPHDPTPGA